MLSLLPLLLACRAGRPDPPAPAEWAFLFYVPYDNDLSPLAPAVIEGVRAGTDGGIPAALLVDTVGEPPRLLACAGGRCRAEPLPEAEDTGDIASFQLFLARAAAAAPAERYGVALLDHGGRLGELARDDDRGAHGGTSWLDIERVAAELEGFRGSGRGEIELLFLQVCAKASLEPLYTFRDSARYTLASQLMLAAPNTWYTPVLRALAAEPGRDGPAVAAAIAAADGREMYASYTCIDNARLAGLPARLAPLAGAAPAPLDAVAAGVYAYAGDGYVDAAALLAAQGQAAAAADLAALRCGHFRSRAPPAGLLAGYPDLADLSGISLYVPPEAGLPAGYEALDLYRESGLEEWMAGAIR